MQKKKHHVEFLIDTMQFVSFHWPPTDCQLQLPRRNSIEFHVNADAEPQFDVQFGAVLFALPLENRRPRWNVKMISSGLLFHLITVNFFFFFDLIFNIYSTGKSWSTHLGFLFGCCVSMYDAILRKTSVTCYLGTVSFISFYYLCCFVFIWTFIELERAGWLIWSPVDLWLIIKEVLRNDSLEGLWFSSELGKTCSVLSHTTCWTNRLNGIIEEIVRIQP